MPQLGYGSIRNQSSSLNISKGGSTSIYVDKNSVTASDNNDGFDWDRPKKTIGGATAILEPWMELWIKSGIYQENVIIPYENVKIHGVVQSGTNRAEIAPLSGVPLKFLAGYCEMEGMSIVAQDNNCLEAIGPGHKIHDCYFEVNNVVPVTQYIHTTTQTPSNSNLVFTSLLGPSDMVFVSISSIGMPGHTVPPISVSVVSGSIYIVVNDLTIASEIITAVNSDPVASLIVLVSLASGNDGSGIFVTYAGSPVSFYLATEYSYYPNKSCVLLDDCDKFELYNCYLTGKSGENVIGVRLDGTLNATVDSYIHDNYFVDFGDVGLAGHGINLNNAQRALVVRNIFDSGYTGVYLPLLANSLHSIVGNQFYANAGVDVVDMNSDVVSGGNFIRNNFFGYVGWFDDVNHDGIADHTVQCQYNYDYSPLSSPHYQGPSFVPRRVA
jgi:hypothetical protein